MAKPLAVLLVEDSESDTELVIRHLRKAGYKVDHERVETAEGMRAALEKQAWDIVISDYSLPQFNGAAALTLLQEMGQDIPFIVVSGTIGEETAVAMMKAGAFDYLMKNNLVRLVPAIERELEQAVVRREHKQAQEKIRDSEKRFRALIENSSDAITLLDAKGNVLYDSPSAPGLLGYGPIDWVGKDAFNLMHPDDLQKNQDIVRDLQKTPGKRAHTIFRVRHKSGSWLWIEATATNLLEEPTVNAIVLNYRDITGRKQAEDALRENESILRGFLQQSEDAIMLTDEQGAVIQWSRGAERLTGYSRDESLGKPLWDVQYQLASDELKSPETYEHLKAILQEALRTGRGTFLNHLIDAEIHRPNGTHAATQSLAFPIQTDKGFMLGSILRDISGRKRREEQLVESESRYKGLFEDSPIALWEEDFSAVKGRLDALRADGITNLQEYFTSHPEAVTECATLIKVLDVNKAAIKLLGANEKGDLFNGLVDILKNEPNQEFQKELINIAEGKTGFGWEGSNRTLDGRLIDIDLRWSAVPGHESTLSRVLVSMMDITERKKTEDALNESQKRYRALFEDTPIAIWEEDFSELKKHLEALSQKGKIDLRTYFKTHPEALSECATLIRILDVNKAALKLYRANSKEGLLMRTEQDLSRAEQEHILEDFMAIAQGKTGNTWEGSDETLEGLPIEINLNWSVAPGYEHDFSKVIVTTIDITERKQKDEELQKLRLQNEEAQRIAGIGYWELDLSTNQFTFNDQYYSLHGTTAEEAGGYVMSAEKFASQYVHPDDAPVVMQSVESAVRSNDPNFHFQRDVRILRADGEVRDVSVWFHSEKNPQGRMIKLIGVNQDITERRQAEAKLAEERNLLNTLINTLPDSIFIKDAGGRILMDNNAHRRTLGADTLEQVVGKTDFDFHPSEQAAVYDAEEKQVIESGEPLIDKLTPFTYKDHSQRWLLTTKVPLQDRHGNITGIVGFNHDITERKQADEKLAGERNLLRTLIDILPDLVYVKDMEGRFILKNLLDARQMGAASPEETIGKTDFDYYPPELAAKYSADDQVVFNSGQPIVNREEPVVDAAGRPGWISTTKVPLRDHQGNVIGLVGIGHDITERKQTEERIQHQLEHLAALRAIDQVIISSFDLRNSLTEILKHVTKELGVDAADVLTLSSGYQALEYSAGVGFRTRAAEKASVHLDHSFAGRVVLERQLIKFSDLKSPPDGLQLRTQLADENFVCYYGVPLIAKGNVKGVLEIFQRTSLEPDREWLEFLNTLADQAALAIDNARLFENLQRSNIDLTLAYDATIEGWSRAMDLRDKETEGHTLRVTEMTMELATLFGINDESMVGIRRGALLHDIGKMGVPDGVLLKPGPLTDEEWILMKKHPALAFEMLSPIHYLQSAIDIPYCHHEKWDGTGYPRGLKGEQIPLAARIFALADVWDALTSDRPYRNAWPNEKALEYLKSEAGKHFDPAVVKICLDAGVFIRKK